MTIRTKSREQADKKKGRKDRAGKVLVRPTAHYLSTEALVSAIEKARPRDKAKLHRVLSQRGARHD